MSSVDAENQQIDDEDCNEIDENLSKENLSGSHWFASVTLRVLFSTPGLVILVALYSVMGALIFPLLEAPVDVRNTAMVVKSRDECLKELWTITGEFLCLC